MKFTYSSRGRQGFTIMELLVVVGILAVLIGILIPSLHYARASGRKSATLSQMRYIAIACDSYYTMFSAYPGFISEQSWSDSNVTDAFSSTQSLVVSLSGRYFASDPTGAPYGFSKDEAATVGATQVGKTSYYIARNQNVSPRNYAVNTAATGYPGPGRDYDAFLAAKPSDLSTAILPGLPFPVLVDSSYGVDALPILYYRQHIKPNPLDANYLVVREVYNTPANAVASFYVGANHHLAALGSQADGASAAFVNSKIDRLSLTHDDCRVNTGAMVTQTLAGTPNVPRGRYVLVSPGPDRIYGLDADGKCDDLIVSGGN